ncbi:MAG: hypothetical protein IJZ20_01615, partial [Clostridia bacterium]|nr:hypothetical protein [Clostridia bacterium]
FDEATGMNGDEIRKKLLENDAQMLDLSHAIRKAKAIEFVLDNTRICCDSRDIFPAINCVDRPLDNTIIGKWRGYVFGTKIPHINERKDFLDSNAMCTAWIDYCHSRPVFDRLLSLGFKGILDDCNARYAFLKTQRTLIAEEIDFFESIDITYKAVIRFTERLEKLALQTEGSEKMAKALGNIKENPPATFYEAMLVNYIYFMISEHVDGLQVRTLSNFDRHYYPYYLKDLQNGKTEEELRTELAYFLLQFTAIGNYWGQPVYLGGCKADESTEINELSYVFMDVYDKMHLYNPKIQIKVADSTPKDFLMKVLDMIRRGHNSIVLVSDATIRKALENAGATPEDARTCVVQGCYEYGVDGGLGIGMQYFNLLKPLELALNGGYDMVSGKFAGLESPEVTTETTYEELFEEYNKQLAMISNDIMGIVNTFEDYLAYISPQPLLSATFPTCVERAKDCFEGGAKTNESGMLFGFLADAADSFAMIKKYVYEKKLITLPELRDILKNNFEGNEALRLKLYHDKDKYGNNRDLPDEIALEIAEFAISTVEDKPNAAKRGGKWVAGFHVARQSYDQGAKTAASANGRLMGEELAKNISPSMGQNREGATAAILSATKLDATKFPSDACLDLGLLPSAVKGDDGLEAMYGLVQTFIKRHGHAIHINVFDADTLRAAQKEPEKYADLQIRVCGWNVLFNNINKVEQDGFIKQAESLI